MADAAPLVLHIGLPKTGTTTLQHFLAKNRAALRKRGFAYPLAPGEINHAAFTQHALVDTKTPAVRRIAGLTSPSALAAFRDRFAADLRREASGWTPDETVVVSGEHMSQLGDPAEFARLRGLAALMGERPVRVVVYLRRQDLYCLSDYAQRIRNGSTEPVSALAAEIERPIFDYEAILDRWAEAFGRAAMTVRVYERGQLEGGDVVADFLRTIGCDGTGLAGVARRNEAPGAHILAFMQRMNGRFPRFVDGKLNPRRKHFLDALRRIESGGPPLRMDPALAARFLQRHRAGNDRIAMAYLGRPGGGLFLDRPPDDPPVAAGAEAGDDDTIVRALLALAPELARDLPSPAG